MDKQIKSIAIFNQHTQEWNDYQPVVKAKNVFLDQIDNNFSLQNTLFPFSNSDFINNNYFLSLKDKYITNNNNFISKSFSLGSIEKFFQQDSFYSYDMKNFFPAKYEAENFQTLLEQLIAIPWGNKIFFNGVLWVDPIRESTTTTIPKNTPLFQFKPKEANQYSYNEKLLIDNFFYGNYSDFRFTMTPASERQISPFPVTIFSQLRTTDPYTILETNFSNTCYMSYRFLYLSNTFSQTFETSSTAGSNFYRIHFSIFARNNKSV